MYKKLRDGANVTVFARRDGLFGVCIYTDDDGAQYSDDCWETEEEGIDAANEWIEQGLM
jgi:hypothetical protein